MASTAWTAPRADLVKALAQSRARELAATDRSLDLIARLYLAEANRQDATETLALVRAALQRQRLIVPPDPNAALHRRTLIAALKEKP